MVDEEPLHSKPMVDSPKGAVLDHRLFLSPRPSRETDLKDLLVRLSV